MTKLRGFEEVKEEHKQYGQDVMVHGKKITVYPDVILPTRADVRSAGYDFYLPTDIEILPNHKTIIWTNVKAYMQEDEVLEIYIRSSLAVKQGLMLTNNVGIVDSSYYGNEGNDGNIGIAVVNTSGKGIHLKAGERIAQGVFKKYLVADNGNPDESVERTGGFGSSGK